MRTCLIGAALSTALIAPPLAAQPAGDVGQLYSYRLVDRPAFVEGYRAHLQWHADHKDVLVWYAWTVASGPRAGLFIDGTFGATFASLDRRPDLPGDGANFAATAAPHATALGNETWRLWSTVSTATPLEAGKPSSTVDVFRLTVSPPRAAAFEAALARIAAAGKEGTPGIAWYRVVRGGSMPGYVAMLARESWADVDRAGDGLPDILGRAYGATPEGTAAVMAQVDAIAAESWSYEPRLSLFPGRALAP